MGSASWTGRARAICIVGHSGAARARTARLWTTLHEVEILSDDRIIIREDKVREERRARCERIFHVRNACWRGLLSLCQGALRCNGSSFWSIGRGNVLTRLPRQASGAFARSFGSVSTGTICDSALAFLPSGRRSVPCLSLLLSAEDDTHRGEGCELSVT